VLYHLKSSILNCYKEIGTGAEYKHAVHNGYECRAYCGNLADAAYLVVVDINFTCSAIFHRFMQIFTALL